MGISLSTLSLIIMMAHIRSPNVAGRDGTDTVTNIGLFKFRREV